MTSPAMSAWGRAGAYANLAKHGGEKVSAPARQGLQRKFEREVLAAAAANGETLDAPELAKRAAYAMRSHMMLCAEKSAQSRAAKKANRK